MQLSTTHATAFSRLTRSYLTLHNHLNQMCCVLKIGRLLATEICKHWRNFIIFHSKCGNFWFCNL